MRRNTKNMTIALLAGASALLMGGALALNGVGYEVSAAEGDVLAFLNAGASEKAVAFDTALGLTAGGITAGEGGTVVSGDSFFEGYSTGVTYTVALSAGTYEVAVALDVADGNTLTVNGEAVSLDGKSGRTVVSAETTVEGDSFEIEATGKLCGILVAEQGGKIFMAADYNAGQVVKYGALLSEELDASATGYYSDGTSEELAIRYGDINASTGVNVNFTTIDVDCTVTVGDDEVSLVRHITTMPDDLVYFINCGSFDVPEPSIVREDFSTDAEFQAEQQKTIDGFYSYNRMVAEYYGGLLNEVPDKATTQGGDWGCYTGVKHFAPGDATFPYNSAAWTGGGNGVTDMGYMLSGLEASETYRIWFGSLSHWHGRTSNITFNGEVADNQPTISIGASKGLSIFKNVKPDANGKIDIHLTQIGSENEPTLCFIAVQKMSTEVAERGADLSADPIIGMEDTSVTVTGAEEGSVIRLYNEAKPNQLLYEEEVDAEKLSGGSYTVEFGINLRDEYGVLKFCVVQITSGGISRNPLVISITDIDVFETSIPEGYSLGSVTVTVKSHASSGIVSWSWRKGEYGEEHLFSLDLPANLEEGFVAEENGDYYVVVTSGLGVTREEVVSVTNIDPDRPVITLTPSSQGFAGGGYVVTVAVRSIAPVTEFKLFKDGAKKEEAASVPESYTFTEAGDYVLFVKTATGLSSSSNLRISEQPTTTLIKKTYASGTYRYAFTDTSDYRVASVTVHKIDVSGKAESQSIDTGNIFPVYGSGKYVVTVKTTDGTTEMFALDIAAADIKGAPKAGVSSGLSLGLGLGVGIGGVVIAAAAITVCFLVTRKKKS